jgi:hypothetical protein
VPSSSREPRRSLKRKSKPSLFCCPSEHTLLLAGSPNGCTEAILMAHGFHLAMLSKLAFDGVRERRGSRNDGRRPAHEGSSGCRSPRPVGRRSQNEALADPLHLPRLDPRRDEVAEASTDPVIRPRIRRGALLHIDDDARGSPTNLRWSVQLSEADLSADEEVHWRLQKKRPASRTGPPERDQEAASPSADDTAREPKGRR